MSRIYLGHRASTPGRAERAALQAITDWRQTEIRNALGQKFRSSIQVNLRRPWWMPSRLYLALMRSVVVSSKSERLR